MNKTTIFSLIAVFVLVLLPACWPFGAKEKRRGVVAINVLEKELHDDCHIAGSINIPVDEIDRVVDEVDTSAHVIVYCSNYMCTASEFARERLKELGFTNVQAYEAGMAEWYAAGLPVEGVCQQGYLRMPMRAPEGYVSGEGVIETAALARALGYTPGAQAVSTQE